MNDSFPSPTCESFMLVFFFILLFFSYFFSLYEGCKKNCPSVIFCIVRMQVTRIVGENSILFRISERSILYSQVTKTLVWFLTSHFYYQLKKKKLAGNRFLNVFFCYMTSGVIYYQINFKNVFL